MCWKNYYAGQIWFAGLTLPTHPSSKNEVRNFLIVLWLPPTSSRALFLEYLVVHTVFQNPRFLLILGLMSFMDGLFVVKNYWQIIPPIELTSVIIADWNCFKFFLNMLGLVKTNMYENFGYLSKKNLQNIQRWCLLAIVQYQNQGQAFGYQVFVLKMKVAF